MSNPYMYSQHEQGRLRQREGMNTRAGWIDDIQTGQGGEMKVRAVIGYRPDGTPVKGPWLNMKGQKGTDRERRAPVKGQNVQLVAPNGDYQQAWLQAGAEGDHAPHPDHAETHGKEAYTFQNNDSRMTSKEGLHESWIAEENTKPPAHDGSTGMETQGGGSGGGSGGSGGSSGSSGQQGQQQGQQGGGRSAGKPMMKHVMDKESGAIAGCYGEKSDYYADKDMARIFHTKENVFWVDKKGCWTTKPIRVQKHPKDHHPRAGKA